MHKDFEIEISGLGFQRENYPGAFTPTVKKIIKNIIQIIEVHEGSGKPNVLHLFSGVSKIGTERIDLECKEHSRQYQVRS